MAGPYDHAMPEFIHKLVWLAFAGLLIFTPVSFVSAQSADDHAGDSAHDSTEISDLAALLFGRFEARAETPDDQMVDRRVRVPSDALSGVWYYYQVNHRADWSVYRQRVNRLTLSDDGTTILQHTYTLKSPEDYVDIWDDPARLAALSEADFEPFLNDGCEQVWKRQEQGGWFGYVDPKTCRIFSTRRNKHIHIEAEAIVTDAYLKQTERGFNPDGSQLWGSKPGEFITLYR